MKYKIKSLVLAVALVAIVMPTAPILAEEEIITEVNSNETTIAEIGATNASQVNNATIEATETTPAITGTLIEIGNTTAEKTTVVVRTTNKTGQAEDITLEVPTATVALTTASGSKADLSDWISGDQITFTAKKFLNSGALQAKKIINRSFKSGQKGVNGWIKEIRINKNEVDVNVDKNIYTLNLAEAKIAAGIKNPATINDLKVGDRIRARVIDDKDKNPATWKAKIIVVLRRGDNLFMRITHYVIPAKIISIPTDLSLPTVIEAEVLPSKFYQKGDVNNLVGIPGTRIYININDNTKLVRRFFGKSLLSEMSVGDTINVVGRLDEKNAKLKAIENELELYDNEIDSIGAGGINSRIDPDIIYPTQSITAKIIKNESIQVLGVAQRLGQITAVDTVAKTVTITILPEKANRNSVLLNTTDKTKIFRDGKKATISDLAVGDIVKAKGVYNRNKNAVEAKVIGATSQATTCVSNETEAETCFTLTTELERKAKALKKIKPLLQKAK
ncbi:MAG: DUF5666 domain-containing protein [bacterium]|nr:DUF5666 domain-containing protein [bacterium]